MAVGVPQDSRAWRTRRSPPGRGEVRTASPAVGAAERSVDTGIHKEVPVGVVLGSACHRAPVQSTDQLGIVFKRGF